MQTDTLHAIVAELKSARTKHPHNRHMFAALSEEVGELAQALLFHAGEKPGEDTADRVIQEAIQVACVAVRIIEEGDADFGLVVYRREELERRHRVEEVNMVQQCGDAPKRLAGKPTLVEERPGDVDPDAAIAVREWCEREKTSSHIATREIACHLKSILDGATL